MTSINLNDRIFTGISVQHTNRKGKVTNKEFQCISITEDANEFLNVAQYIVDSCPDLSRFVVIHNNAVIGFKELVETIGLKSKRY